MGAMQVNKTSMTPVKTFDVADMKAQPGNDYAHLTAKIVGAVARSEAGSAARAARGAAAEPAKHAAAEVQVSAQNKALHQTAKAGNLTPQNFKDAAAVTAFLNRTLQMMQATSLRRSIARRRPEERGALAQGEPWERQQGERLASLLEKSRIELFIQWESLATSLGLNGPLLVEDGDTLRLGTFNVSYEGTDLARSMGDGTFAAYRFDGDRSPA